ncbi:MAG TPA: putative lipid II flippase FtsW [Solirubrobacteraceae bacterium]|jgi:cell division protein FtsW
MARRTSQQPLEHRLLLTATFCLLAGGAVMVYSASSARSLLQGQGDGTAYLVKYVIYGAIGLVAMHLIARGDLATVRRLTPILLAVSFVLLVAVLLPGLGLRINGARRWIGAGQLQFQPSELMKLALVLHAAAVLAARPKLARSLRALGGPILGVGACALALVAAEPDLGTALVISFTLAAMLVAAGVPLRQLGLVAAVGAFLIVVFAIVEPYRRARLTAFLHPWADAGGSGFQAVQGQIAIGSGGLLGHGPGQSVQKIFYLPEAHTDFILAVIGEELGLAGILGLLSLYGMIGYAGLRTARNAAGAYAKLLAGGLTSLILCQALLNVYAVLGLAPLTGVPLPFISSGSSSLVVMLCAMGLLLNVAAGGSAHLRAVRGRGERAADRDRGGRDGRARDPGAGRRRRAAG